MDCVRSWRSSSAETESYTVTRSRFETVCTRVCRPQCRNDVGHDNCTIRVPVTPSSIGAHFTDDLSGAKDVTDTERSFRVQGDFFFLHRERGEVLSGHCTLILLCLFLFFFLNSYRDALFHILLFCSYSNTLEIMYLYEQKNT